MILEEKTRECFNFGFLIVEKFRLVDVMNLGEKFIRFPIRYTRTDTVVVYIRATTNFGRKLRIEAVIIRIGFCCRRVQIPEFRAKNRSCIKEER